MISRAWRRFRVWCRYLRLEYNRWRHVRVYYSEPTCYLVNLPNDPILGGHHIVAHPEIVRGFQKLEDWEDAESIAPSRLPGYLGGTPVIVSEFATVTCWRWEKR